MAELFHVESEQSVLGGLLIDPNSMDRIDWLAEYDFYREDHRVIFRHITALLAERKPVDVVTVAESLSSAGIDEQSIGLAYLGELASNTPSASNITRYAEVVAEKRKLRDLLAASNQIAELAHSEGGMTASERIDAASGIVFGLAEKSAKVDDEPELISSVLASVIEDIQARVDAGGAITGLPTGFADIDKKTSGLGGGDLVILAGRPSMGKTAMALNIAENVAVVQQKPVLVFSMEMSKKQLTERSISSIGAIPMGDIRSGQLTEEQYSQLSFSMGKLMNSRLVIDDRPALSVAQMRSRARRVAKKHGISLVVIDYIQLAQGDMTSKNGNREQEVSSISRGLKALAKEFNVPVIALSQLSRKVEERGDKRPMMSDLRESGAIEQDADIIMFLYRDEYYNPNSPDKGVAEVIIAKQRMGETGAVPVLFQGQYSRFRDLTEQAKANIAESRRAAEQERSSAKPMRRSRGVE